MEIRALQESDDRAAFRSGDPDIDRFFRQFAGQNQFRHHLGVSYVAVREQRVLGFATIAAAHIEVENLPAAARKKAPRYPLPVLRMARLGVDESAQGQGIGLELLRFILLLGLKMAESYGCVGIVVDAKPGAADFYAKFGFIPMEAVEGASAARPAPLPMFLSLRAIAQSTGRRK